MTKRRSSAHAPDVAEIREHRHAMLRQMIAAYVADGVGLDAAIASVVEETRRSRATLYKIWKAKP